MEKHLQQTRDTQAAEEQRQPERQTADHKTALATLQAALQQEGVLLTELSNEAILALADRIGNSAAAELLREGRGIQTTRFLFRESAIRSPVNEIHAADVDLAGPFNPAGGEGANLAAGSPRAISDGTDGIGLAGGMGGMDGSIPSGG